MADVGERLDWEDLLPAGGFWSLSIDSSSPRNTMKTSYTAETNTGHELIRFSSFSYRFLGTSGTPAVPATIHDVQNTAAPQAGKTNTPSSKVHSGWSGRITPAGAWESACAWDLTQVEHGLCASLPKRLSRNDRMKAKKWKANYHFCSSSN